VSSLRATAHQVRQPIAPTSDLRPQPTCPSTSDGRVDPSAAMPPAVAHRSPVAPTLHDPPRPSPSPFTGRR
jgi:hypothetical protein